MLLLPGRNPVEKELAEALGKNPSIVSGWRAAMSVSEALVKIRYAGMFCFCESSLRKSRSASKRFAASCCPCGSSATCSTDSAAAFLRREVGSFFSCTLGTRREYSTVSPWNRTSLACGVARSTGYSPCVR